MPGTKVIPAAVIRTHHHHHGDSLKLTDKWEDDYGSGNRNCHDYWHARRAFLNSYRFTEQTGFKDKVKRRMKELNEEALGMISNCLQVLLSRRRLGTRAFRVKLGLPSLALVSTRCFTPWLNKKG
ncbi:hypothetical protein V6N13_074949 [Hibiscus sabdariffa]|uniref:Cathepsin propeptide inhibitor domain-containing protein n=1 Tax=Hibiscus sabdariffa TaxID=183260 RepID=A0ABR2UA08_9ROSI